MGRSYTASSNKRAGLGAERRGLTTKSFNIDDDSEPTPSGSRPARAQHSWCARRSASGAPRGTARAQRRSRGGASVAASAWQPSCNYVPDAGTWQSFHARSRRSGANLGPRSVPSAAARARKGLSHSRGRCIFGLQPARAVCRSMGLLVASLQDECRASPGCWRARIGAQSHAVQPSHGQSRGAAAQPATASCPHVRAPSRRAELVLDSLPAPNLNTSTKADILAYFLNSYDLNSSLFALLKNDSVFYMKPDVLRRPLM